MDAITNLLTRGVENIYPNKEDFEKVLRSGKKIRLYQGFDPSMPSLHLGNFVGLMKLRQFQKLGHEVIFLVGDFTGMIGDPTDKSATRKMLTRDETLKNSQTWQDQASRVLDFEGSNPVKLKFNSEWLDQVSFKDLIETTSHFTFQQLIERDMFQNRLKEDKPIYFHEFLYPIAQAIDCVEMEVDLEIGGNDQTFNMLTGRTLMKATKNKEKFVLATKLLVDKDGNKVGKTTGNALFLDSTPENFYSGIMAFPDEVIALGFELLTEVDLQGIDEKVKTQPLAEKKRLAFEIVKLLWGEQSAQKAQDQFQALFQNKTPVQDLPVVKVSQENITAEALVLLACPDLSRSEIKRLITQKAIDLDQNTLEKAEEIVRLKNGAILKVGKTKFFKIQILGK